MNFKDQIDSIDATIGGLQTVIDTSNERIAKLRSDVGRLKRTYNAMVDNDIDVDMEIGGLRYKTLSAMLEHVIDTKSLIADDMEAEVVDTKVQLKKLNKARDTFASLMDDDDTSSDDAKPNTIFNCVYETREE